MDYIAQRIAQLRSVVTPERSNRIAEVLATRTRYLTVALEDIQQSNNISAALRSIEAFGLQEVSIIEGRYSYTANQSITKGAGEWVDTVLYNIPDRNNTALCYEALRKRGYHIVATTPHPHGKILPKLSIDRPIALVFGTEETGLSEYALSTADEYVTIPMFGFTKSFNISVSVALCVYDLIMRIHASDKKWQLSADEQRDLELIWLERYLSR